MHILGTGWWDGTNCNDMQIHTGGKVTVRRAARTPSPTHLTLIWKYLHKMGDAFADIVPNEVCPSARGFGVNPDPLDACPSFYFCASATMQLINPNSRFDLPLCVHCTLRSVAFCMAPNEKERG